MAPSRAGALGGRAEGAARAAERRCRSGCQKDVNSRRSTLELSPITTKRTFRR
jgi:hypothetical protein